MFLSDWRFQVILKTTNRNYMKYVVTEMSSLLVKMPVALIKFNDRLICFLFFLSQTSRHRELTIPPAIHRFSTNSSTKSRRTTFWQTDVSTNWRSLTSVHNTFVLKLVEYFLFNIVRLYGGRALCYIAAANTFLPSKPSDLSPEPWSLLAFVRNLSFSLSLSLSLFLSLSLSYISVVSVYWYSSTV